MLGPGFPPGQVPAPAAVPAPAGNGPSPAELLDAMLKIATLYHAAETDQKDRLTMEKVTTLLQQIRADRQAGQDRLLGPNARLLRG